MANAVGFLDERNDIAKMEKKPMSLHPTPIGLVPEETARVAQAVFRKSNLCLRLRKVLGSIYEDGLFADLLSPTGRIEE